MMSQKTMLNPKVRAIMERVKCYLKVVAAMQECMGNPMA